MDEFDRIIARGVRQAQRQARDRKAKHIITALIAIILASTLLTALAYFLTAKPRVSGTAKYECTQLVDGTARTYNQLVSGIEQAKIVFPAMEDGEAKQQVADVLDIKPEKPAATSCATNPEDTMSRLGRQDEEYERQLDTVRHALNAANQ